MKDRIDPQAPLTAEIQRIVTDELTRATADLETARSQPERGFHQTRKRLKKLRALYRLLRSADRPFWNAENIRLRDVARGLAGAREAAALIETMDRLTQANSRESGSGGLTPIREALVRHHDRIVRNRSGQDGFIDEAIRAIEEGRRSVEACALPHDPQAAADILADGAASALRRALRALELARKHGREDDFHELRKAVKDHWTHLTLLASFWPKPVKSRRKQVGSLGDCLGELNDLFVLRELIDRRDECLGADGDLQLLQRLLRRSEKKLRKKCLDEAEKLFDVRPAKLGRRLADHYREGAGETPRLH